MKFTCQCPQIKLFLDTVTQLAHIVPEEAETGSISAAWSCMVWKTEIFVFNIYLVLSRKIVWITELIQFNMTEVLGFVSESEIYKEMFNSFYCVIVMGQFWARPSKRLGKQPVMSPRPMFPFHRREIRFREIKFFFQAMGNGPAMKKMPLTFPYICVPSH